MGLKHVFGALVASFIGLQAAQAEEPLRLGTEGAYPPFNFTDSAGKLSGFDIEIGNALCKAMKRKCVWTAQDWDGIIPGLIANKYDLIVASMFITEERAKQVAFSDPYYKAAFVHVADKKSGLKEITSESLKGRVIGLQSGTAQVEYVKKAFPNAKVRLYSTQDDVNLDLTNGRIDVIIGDIIPMEHWLKSDDAKCCAVVGKPQMDPKFVGRGAGIAARKKDSKLLAEVNAALAKIIADGTYKKINDRHFEINLLTFEK